MRKYFHRYHAKSKKIIGLTLALIGFIIIISVMPIEFLIALIGIGLLIMGFLLIRIK